MGKTKQRRKLDIRAFLTKKKIERLNQIEAEPNLPNSETDIRTDSQNLYPIFLSQNKEKIVGATAQYRGQTKSEGDTAKQNSTKNDERTQLIGRKYRVGQI